MNIAVGSDHAGYPLKKKLLSQLEADGNTIIDFGSYNEEPVDFPDIAALICKSIKEGKAKRGILFCGTGVGAAIACNKHAGIRAAVCHDLYSAHQCVEHDDVQVLCLGAQVIGHSAAIEIIRLFLKAEFSTSEEFVRRVEKLAVLDGSKK